MRNILFDVGTLILRVAFGATILIAHGQYKLRDYGEMVDTFPDPLGIGSQFSLILTIFAECICSSLLVIGLLTRLAVIPLIITMAVALFLVHADDPWSKKELAASYFYGFSAILLTGPGRISVDNLIARWRKKKSISTA